MSEEVYPETITVKNMRFTRYAQYESHLWDHCYQTSGESIILQGVPVTIRILVGTWPLPGKPLWSSRLYWKEQCLWTDTTEYSRPEDTVTKCLDAFESTIVQQQLHAIAEQHYPIDEHGNTIYQKGEG